MAEAILFASDIDDPAPWRDVLAKGFPELEFRVWPELGRPEEILYALIWKIQGGVLGTLPNLRAIFALGAGVDQNPGRSRLPEAHTVGPLGRSRPR